MNTNIILILLNGKSNFFTNLFKTKFLKTIFKKFYLIVKYFINKKLDFV